MAVRGYFSHNAPEGDRGSDRATSAGYDVKTWGENIAFGYGSPRTTMDKWLSSDTHCANVMDPKFTNLGVGFFPGGSTSIKDSWVEAFGA